MRKTKIGMTPTKRSHTSTVLLCPPILPMTKKVIFTPQICQQIEAIISKWRIAIKKFHLRRGLWTVHLSSTAGSALRDSRARIGWGSMRRTKTALPRKLSTYDLSKVVTKCFSEKGNLKVHLCTHTGDRPFECFKCAKRFTSLGN